MRFPKIYKALSDARREMDDDNWSRGLDACDADAREVSIDDPSACRFCVLARVIQPILKDATVEDVRYVRSLLDRAVVIVSDGRHEQIFEFNDDAMTTIDDVRSAIVVAQQLLWRDERARDQEKGEASPSRMDEATIEAIVDIAWRGVHGDRFL